MNEEPTLPPAPFYGGFGHADIGFHHQIRCGCWGWCLGGGWWMLSLLHANALTATAAAAAAPVLACSGAAAVTVAIYIVVTIAVVVTIAAGPGHFGRLVGCWVRQR